MVACIVHLTLVLLYFCVVIIVYDNADLMAITYILYPENASTEHTDKNEGRNFINAPLRSP
jgi:hypothetical protein